MRIYKLRKIAVIVVCWVVLWGTAHAKPLVFAVWSDSHFGAYDYADTTRLGIIDQINSLGEKDMPDGLSPLLSGGKVEFLLHCGDITERGEPGQWNDPNIGDHRSYLRTISHLDPAIKTYAVLGNHDSRKESNVRKDFADLYGSTYYSFDAQGVHFVMLDPYSQFNTAAPRLDEEQLKWLKSDLAKIDDARLVVMVMHVLPVSDTAIGRTSRLDESSSAQLAKLLAGKNVLAFLHGHWHNQSVKDFNSIPVIAPAGFAYYRDGCKHCGPVIGVVAIDGGKISVYTYDWEKEQFLPEPLISY